MKIFICAIMKDEEKNLSRFYESCKDADGIYILDTGSTDKSVEVAKSLGSNIFVTQKTYDKFRFDIARNDAIALLPKEDAWVIHLDIDEFLVGEWKQELLSLEKTDITNVNYMYVFEYVNNKPGTSFLANKITRNGYYKFQYPIHETIVPVSQHHKIYTSNKFRIDQIQDKTKNRNYKERLEEALKTDECKNHPTIKFYLLKEYFIMEKFGACIDLAKDIVNGNRNDISMVSAMIAAYSVAKLTNDLSQKEDWLLRAIDISPFRREPYMELMRLYQSVGNVQKAFWAGVNLFNIQQRRFDFIEMAEAWTDEPHRRFADICKQLGYDALAKNHMLIAEGIIPMRDERGAKGLKDLIETFAGEGLTVAEIGSYTGESTVIFASSPKISRVYAIDIWKNGEVCEYVTFGNMETVEKLFDERVNNNQKIVKMKMSGDDAHKAVADVDVAYIDAIHTYEAVKNDIATWSTKVKNGGYLCGHDYDNGFPGVQKAVDEFCNERKLGRPQTFIDGSWCIRIIK